MAIEVGDVLCSYLEKMKYRIERIVQNNYDKGVTGKYYIHFWFQTVQTERGIRFLPMYLCRKTRPSPYQMEDHYLWSVEDGGKVTFQWCIPKEETLAYILSHPYEFDADYVRMLRKFTTDKLEKIEDYLVGDKVI